MQQKHPLIHLLVRVTEAYGIPCHIIKPPFHEFNTVDMGLRQEIFHQEIDLNSLNNLLSSLPVGNIYILNDIFECSYILFYLPGGEELAVFGPFLFERMNRERFEELLDKRKIPANYDLPLYLYYKSITILPAENFFKTFILEIGKEIFDDSTELIPIDLNRDQIGLIKYNDFTRSSSNVIPYIDVLTVNYELENKLISAVTKGNIDVALELSESIIETLDMVPARFQPALRDYKDHTISLITVIRKSLEINGLHPIYFDQITTDYIQKTEHCTTIDQLKKLIKKILISYCDIVRENHHKPHSSFIDTILAYIHADLSGNLTLNALAGHLNVNASYLSSLFSKEMGMTLTEYVTSKRMDRAIQLLVLTDTPIKSVAEQCGYADIHYFSRIFKKRTGFSPKNFHETYYKTDHSILQHLYNKKTDS